MDAIRKLNYLDFPKKPMRISIPILSIVLLLSACANKAPELGKGLPRSWSDQTPYFDERIKQRFPIGSDKVALINELRSERFSIRENHESQSQFKHIAVYEQPGLCRETWVVTWDEDQAKLSKIEGHYHQVCL